MNIERREFLRQAGETVVAASLTGLAGGLFERVEAQSSHNPYPTVVHTESGLAGRGAYNSANWRRPAWLLPTNEGFEFGYLAGHREPVPVGMPNEAVIQLCATNYLSSGARVSVSGRSYSLDETKSLSRKLTDSNGFVVAELYPDGTLGRGLATLVDTREGMFHVESGDMFEYNHEDGWTQPMDLHLNSQTVDSNGNQAKIALALLGRPATTDSAPAAGMALSLSLLEGQVLNEPMIGDGQVILKRQANIQHFWLRIQNSKIKLIMPDTGKLVFVDSNEVKGWLRRSVSNSTDRLIKDLLVAQLVCISQNMDPRTTAIGQSKPVDSELFRSAAAVDPRDGEAHPNEIVFTGLCTPGGLARNVSRAIRSVAGPDADMNNRSDLVGVDKFVNSLFSS